MAYNEGEEFAKESRTVQYAHDITVKLDLTKT